MQRALGLLLLIVSAVLLFWRLDGAAIWRDEATTAVWGRQMAESGEWIPWVYDRADEQLMVQAPDGHDVNSKLLPAMQSYLQFYVVGLSFKLLGVSETSARLPFALIGAWALWLLYLLGKELFGPNPRALMLPTLAVTSMLFLHAARQCRYYPLVIAMAAWLALEMVRYLKNPERAGQVGFYARLALAGALLYVSNYVSFVCTWGAIGLFILLQGDRRLTIRFCGLSAVMAVPILVEFFALHSEFAESWPPEPSSLWESWRGSFVRRGQEFWRMLPAVFIAPAAVWMAWKRAPAGAKALMSIGVAAVWLPFVVDSTMLFDLSLGVYGLFCAACLTLPAGLLWTYFALPERGVHEKTALLAGLILIIGPIVTILAGKGQASTRHFYQILPAGLLLVGLAVVALERVRGAAAAGALLLACLVWPQLNLGFGGTEEIVWRQYLGNRTYLQPVIDFFDENVQPGDRVAFLRNVKGMPLYFYRPDIRWVGLLNVDAPHNQMLRGKIADDMFDDAADADWYVVWDPKDEVAKGLDDSYEMVFEYSYANLYGWWDRAREDNPNVRTYRIYRRRPAGT